MLNKTIIAALAALFAFGQGSMASDTHQSEPQAIHLSAQVEHTSASAVEEADTVHADTHAEGTEHASVSPKPYILFRIPVGFGEGLPVTNSMVTGWVISIFLIIALRIAIGKADIIPNRGQAVVESIVGSLRDLYEGIVGKQMIGRTFPLLIALFVFILTQNWSGLLPGVGSFGIVEQTAHGAHLKYFFRPANTDLSMTLGLAIVHFVAWLYFVLRFVGPRHLVFDLFGNKADKKEVPALVYYPLFGVFLMVGCIEVFSIVLRVASLSVRLYGNCFGGESLLTNISGMFAWILPVPFMFLETLIGLVQALVFSLLVAVYIGLICNKDEEHEAGHAH
ncbi:MAG: F0F1 ATP synthase subunit A [Opitutales bacterium]|nr:F0F1 ATP synthase subunit A [Opitutales bacterium]